jgi:hypothetical protein
MPALPTTGARSRSPPSQRAGRRTGRTQAAPANPGRSSRRSVPLYHFGGIGLDLVPAIETPDDQPHLGRCGVAEGHRRAGLGFHGFVTSLPSRSDSKETRAYLAGGLGAAPLIVLGPRGDTTTERMVISSFSKKNIPSSPSSNCEILHV